MREDKMKHQIHITKKPMFCAYRKLNDLSTFSDKELQTFVDENFNKTFASVLYDTSDILINLRNCFNKTKYKKFGYKNGYACLTSTISHEIMHIVLLKENGKKATRCWDNIADKLSEDGYL